MRKPPAIISLTMLISALVLAGCGASGASSTTPITPVLFKSAKITGPIPALYTCDGKDVAPPLEWGTVPSGTSELALLVVGLTPTSPSNSYAVSAEWGVVGINPGLHKLAAGRLPPGAHVGLASDGRQRYSICPKKGVTEHYQFMLYAVPSSVAAIPAKFEDMSVLAALSKPNTPTSAIAQGAFVATYKRK
ncbi:MAG: YbhB/YbcL family Raf kinase inhibitor-like protein [Solirubrobacteraceae bacterium]